MVKKTKSKKKSKINDIKKFIIINKNKIIILILLLLDILLVFWAGRKNVVNYVEIDGKNVLVGAKKVLFLGRNCINLVITCFIYIYSICINKVLLNNKIKLKYWLLILSGILLFNIILFFIFTNRVY